MRNKLFKKRSTSDKAASNAVSFIFIMSFIMVLMASFTDMAMYFHVKNQLQSAAQAGARATAIYGGANTKLVNTYGGGVTPQKLTYDAIPSSLRDDGVVIAPIKQSDITCTSYASAGRRVSCTITYDYKGVFTLKKPNPKMTNMFGSTANKASSVQGKRSVSAYAVSEVTSQ